MKIIGLRINGMRTLVAAEMKIKETGLTPIKARNKAGKTTVLDALEILFKGNEHLENDMITHGQEKMTIEGTVVGDQGEKYKVKKVFTPKTARLEITDEKGFQMSKKPQEFLNSLISDLSFNPRQFLELDGDKKLKDMMKLLKIDFTSLDGKIKYKEQERLIVGREVKNFGDITLGEEVHAIEVAAVVQERNRIVQQNTQTKLTYDEQVKVQQQANQKRNDAAIAEMQAVKTLEDDYNRIKNEALALEEQLKKLLAERDAKLAKIDEINLSINNRPKVEPAIDIFTFQMPEPPKYEDVSELDKKIADASEINAKYVEYNNRKEKLNKKMEKESQYNTLDEEIDALRSDKMKILKEAPMPLPGLGIKLIPGEEEKYGLFYHDTYSENWSEAEGLVIAAQICLSQNPKLRAVFLDKGESMDSETLETFAKWAEDNDMQVVITIVADVPEVEQMEDNTWYIIEGKLTTKEDKTTEIPFEQ